jgi:uncharacterized protein (TIGR00251 family)
MPEIGFANIVEDGLLLRLYVQPGAKVSAVTGVREAGDDLRLKIKLQARAVDGQANAALIELLANMTHVPKSLITLQAGATARLKTVHLRGHGPDLLQKVVLAIGDMSD